MKTHTKPHGYGAWTPSKVIQSCNGETMQQRGDGDWQPSKPLPYYSVFERLTQAWHVLTYQADALYWYFPKGWKRDKDGFHNPN
jgi:hypothetical protein